MKNIKIILLLLLLIVSTVFAKKIIKEDVDLNIMSQKAQKENKHLLLYFKNNECPSCRKLEKFIFLNRDVRKQIAKHFITVKINIYDQEGIIYKDFFDSKLQFSKYLNISFYPTILFMDENNDLVYTSKGYKMKSKFKKILQYVNSKSYLDVDFITYQTKK